MKKYILLLLLAIFVSAAGHVSAQTTWDYRNGYVTAGNTASSFTSVNAATGAGVTVNELFQLDVGKLFDPKNLGLTGGLIANMNASGGEADLLVYLYDPNQANGKGPLLYGTYSTVSSTTFYEKAGIPIQDQPGDDLVSRFIGFLFHTTRSTTDIRKAALAANLAYRYDPLHDLSGDPFVVPMKNKVPVIVTLNVVDATVQRCKIPGIGEFAPFDAFYTPVNNLPTDLELFTNPQGHPNYTTIAAHRGYFRDVADNSMPALRLAIGLQVPMVEIDVQPSEDSVWVLSHDALLGQTRRTRVPQRLQYLLATYPKGIPISQLSLCDLRPDLCNNACPFAAISGPCEPVWLAQQDGPDSTPIPTMNDAMLLCKEKVLLDMDKMDKGHSRAKAPYHQLWQAVVNQGMQGKVIVKGTNWPDPQNMIDSFPDVDWTKMMYTPTFFPETPNITTATIDAWVANPKFSCPGFESIYYMSGDPIYNLIGYIKSKNKQVIQFPMWPEYCGHIITDPRLDYRSSWNWLLDTPERRPTMIITDRLEVLLTMLQANNLLTP